MWIYMLVLYISIIIYYYRNRKKIYKRYIQKKKKEIDEQLAERRAHCEGLEAVINAREQAVKTLEETMRLGQIQKEEMFKELENYRQIQLDTINHNIEVIKEIKTNETLNQIERDRNKMLEDYEVEKKLRQDEINQITCQLESFRAKQEAINQEILRRRELEDQTDFYRVCLTDEAIADVDLLRITRQNLKKPEIIDKIIYDSYIAKPVLEMIKRVLQNTTCSGIYKITCLETKEIYIGKSTDIKNRWQQHCKTAFNCGTIASSVLHRKMQQYGIENFTFELLEKVSKDQLTEREKFYIDFYKTKETGLNERNG